MYSNKTLAVFTHFSRQFKRENKIYAYNFRELHERTGRRFSINAIKGFFNEFKRLGWVRIEGNDIYFNSLKTITDVKIPLGDFDFILDYLHLQILKTDKNQFEFIKRLGDHNNIQAKSDYRKMRKFNIREGSLKNDKYNRSYVGISKLLGLSKTGAFNAVKSIIQRQWLWKTHQVESLGKATIDILKQLDSSTYFISGGMLYRQKPNFYTFLSNGFPDSETAPSFRDMKLAYITAKGPSKDGFTIVV